MKPEMLFHIQREGVEAGPYDLVQMASLLRKSIISEQTPTRLEGEDAWMPFSWQPQFTVVREIPADAVSSRVEELNEAAADRRRFPIPLPSRITLLRMGAMFLGSLLAGLIAFVVASLDTMTGYLLLITGGATVAVAQCLIMVKILDERTWTLASIFFVPGGEFYYFVTRFWEYFACFCAKYVGLAVAFGALIGLSRHW